MVCFLGHPAGPIRICIGLYTLAVSLHVSRALMGVSIATLSDISPSGSVLQLLAA